MINIDVSEWIILLGVPILTTGATVLANLLLNIRNHRSNIVSKSRVEWINSVREISAEYMNARHNAYSKRIRYLGNYKSKNEKIRKMSEEFFLDSIEQKDEVNRLYNLLRLYFADNTGNEKVHYELRRMNTMLRYDLREMKVGNRTEDEIRNLRKKMGIKRDRINISFSREMNAYLNKEWHRTKENRK